MTQTITLDNLDEIPDLKAKKQRYNKQKKEYEEKLQKLQGKIDKLFRQGEEVEVKDEIAGKWEYYMIGGDYQQSWAEIDDFIYYFDGIGTLRLKKTDDLVKTIREYVNVFWKYIEHTEKGCKT